MRPVWMPRISKLGRYLSSRAASSTRLRVAEVAFPWPRRMRTRNHLAIISDFLTWAEIGMALFHEFDAKGAFLIS